MTTPQGFLRRIFRSRRRRCRRLNIIAAWVVVTAGFAGCRVPTDSVQLILDRHTGALESLPAEQRAELMPYGRPVVTERAEALLPADLLDLDSARAISVRANPDVHSAQARLMAAIARIEQARSRYLPTVVFSHNAARTFHTPASLNRLNTLLQPQPTIPPDVSNTGSIAVTTLLNALQRPLFGGFDPQGNTNPFSEHSTAITATWVLFDGFVREAQVLAAKHLHRAAMHSLVDVERLIVRAVDAAYYQVQLAEEQLRIARADEAFSQEQFDETRKLQSAGRATQADVNNFRVRVLAAQANHTAARGQREVGRVVLAELLGLPRCELPEALALSPLSEESEAELTEPDSARWMKRALQNRPDIRQLRQILHSEMENVHAAQGLFMPTVAMSGSWGFDRRSTIRYTKDDQSSAGAIDFRWELYTGGSRRAAVRAAEAARAEATAKLNRLKLTIQSDVRTAGINVRDAQEQILLQRENLSTARENRRIVQAGYVAGKETLTRLNEAQRDFIAADADLTLARIRLRLAWSDLNAAAATYHEKTP